MPIRALTLPMLWLLASPAQASREVERPEVDFDSSLVHSYGPPLRGASVGEVLEVHQGVRAPFHSWVLEPPVQLTGRPGEVPPGTHKALYGERMDNHLDTSNFTIAWADGEATQTQAERTAAGMEAAWQALVVEQGWLQPVSSDRYLLWVILAADTGHYAYTTWYESEDYPDGYPVIVMDTEYAGYTDWWQSACAHEFSHALQQAVRELSWRREAWYWEASAVWMEELARPELDEYAEMSWYYATEARRRFDSTTNSHEYGMFLLNAYIEEHLTGEGGLLAIWQYASEHQRDDWDEVLAGYLGIPTGEIWAGFVSALIAEELSESSLYYPVETDGSLEDGLEECVATLGTEYYVMPGDGTVSVLGGDEEDELLIAGPSGWGTTLQLERGDVVGVLTPVEPSAHYVFVLELEPEPADSDPPDDGEDPGWPSGEEGVCGCSSSRGAAASWGLALCVLAALRPRQHGLQGEDRALDVVDSRRL